MILTAVYSFLALALLVLPGLGVRVVLRQRSASPAEEFLYCVAITPLVAAVIAIGLLGFSVFTPTRAATLLMIVAIPSAGRLFQLGVKLARRPMVYLLSLLAVPFAWSTTLVGAPPARTFQWYYWNLGSQLSKSGGIPSWVREYGHSIRWLPDYVVFNTMSEAYRGLAPFGSATDQVMAWRIPLALLGVGAVYLMFRLWVSRTAALVGVVVLVPSTWFVLKFNAYKPEAYGAVLGAVAVTILVIGLRRGRRPMVLLAGALLGVDMAVHAIAATAFAGLLGSVAVVEILSMRGFRPRLPELRRARVRSAWVSLVVAAVLGLVISATIGWTLQGRALVFADATHPARGPDGSDPTLTFSRFSSGDFTANPKIDLERELAGNLTKPWTDFTIGPGAGVLLGVLILGGVALAVRGPDRRPRRFLIALAGFALVLTATALVSALNYDTYVPRHTGLSRLAQYSPLVLAGLIAIAVHGYVATLAALAGRDRSRDLRLVVVGAYALGVVAVAGSVLATWNQLGQDSVISRDGEAALARLGRQVGEDETIVGNVGTRGLVTFRTGAVSLLEGRQPFLERASFLNAANRLFQETAHFFTTPGETSFLDRHGIDWIVVADTPQQLGAVNSYGVPPVDWVPQGFALDFTSGGVRLYHRIQPRAKLGSALGPHRDLGFRAATVLVVGAGLGATALAVGSRRRRSLTRPDDPDES